MIRIAFDGECHYHQGRPAKALYSWTIHNGKAVLAEASGTVVGNGLTPTAAQWEALEAALRWLSHYRGPVTGIALRGPAAVADCFASVPAPRHPFHWITTYRDACQKLLAAHNCVVRAEPEAKPPAPPKRTGGGGRPRWAYTRV